jgi:hypothetical protein
VCKLLAELIDMPPNWSRLRVRPRWNNRKVWKKNILTVITADYLLKRRCAFKLRPGGELYEVNVRPVSKCHPSHIQVHDTIMNCRTFSHNS